MKLQHFSISTGNTRKGIQHSGYIIILNRSTRNLTMLHLINLHYGLPALTIKTGRIRFTSKVAIEICVYEKK